MMPEREDEREDEDEDADEDEDEVRVASVDRAPFLALWRRV